MNSSNTDLTINSITSNNHKWVSGILRDHWGSSEVVSRGQIHQADQLPGFIAGQNDDPEGIITYHIEGIQCEIVTINSLREGAGVGAALITAVKEAAKSRGCKRLWLITTNDNTDGLAFYQKMGFQIAALHKGEIEESRKLKPKIHLIGQSGIAIRDEIELEMWL